MAMEPAAREESRPVPAVVAIGSSTNGFRGLGVILNALPAAFPAAVVVVQHRWHRGRSVLGDVLRRHTTLEVKDATDDEPLRPAVVYLAPPDRHLVVEGGRVRLTEEPRVSFTRPSVDVLFESVARACGKRAIGIILSGGGSDGAAGLHAIRRAGGRAIIQLPADAKSTGMPTAAMARAGADYIVKLEDIGPLVAQLVSHDSSALRAVRPSQ